MKQIFTCLTFALFYQSSFSQVITTVGGTSTTGSSSIVCVAGNFASKDNINTASLLDWTDFTLVLGLGCSYYVQSTLNGTGAGSTYAGFHVRGGNLLNLLSGVRIDTYLNGTYVESSSSATLLNLLTGGTGDIYFKTTLPYNELRLNLAGLLTVAYDIDIFYGFGMANVPNGFSLPLNFTSFNAARQKESVTINWEFNTDETVSSTAVGKSLDGSSFKPMAQLTHGQRLYQFKDNSPQEAFYRVAVTTAVKTYYSKVSKVDGYQNGISIGVVNPVRNKIDVKVYNSRQGIYQVQIVNAEGRILYDKKQTLSGTSGFAIDRGGMKSGMYVLKITGPEADVFVKKIVLE